VGLISIGPDPEPIVATELTFVKFWPNACCYVALQNLLLSLVIRREGSTKGENTFRISRERCTGSHNGAVGRMLWRMLLFNLIFAESGRNKGDITGAGIESRAEGGIYRRSRENGEIFQRRHDPSFAKTFGTFDVRQGD